MNQRRWRLLATLLIGLPLIALGAAKDVATFTSRAAVTAKQAYEKKLAAAEHDYRQAVASARTDYAAALEQAKGASTKAGDLDEAIRIRDSAAAIAAETGAADPVAPDRSRRAKLTAGLLNTKWKTPAFSLVLSADGAFTASGTNGSGRWLALDDRRVVLAFDNGWINLLKFDADLQTCTAEESRLTPGWTGKREKGN